MLGSVNARLRGGRETCLSPPPATRGPLFCLNGTRCSDGEACVLDGERCDGFLDCSDHSDEDNCTSRSHKPAQEETCCHLLVASEHDGLNSLVSLSLVPQLILRPIKSRTSSGLRTSTGPSR